MHPRPGWRKAIIRLKCDHTIDTHKPMYLFRVKKKELFYCTECMEYKGCKQVESSDWSNDIQPPSEIHVNLSTGTIVKVH